MKLKGHLMLWKEEIYHCASSFTKCYYICSKKKKKKPHCGIFRPPFHWGLTSILEITRGQSRYKNSALKKGSCSILSLHVWDIKYELKTELGILILAQYLKSHIDLKELYERKEDKSHPRFVFSKTAALPHWFCKNKLYSPTLSEIKYKAWVLF